MKVAVSSITIILLFLFTLTEGHAQRKTVWLDGGVTTTSNGWRGTPNAMKDFYNYNFIDLEATNQSVSQDYDYTLGIRNFDPPTTPTAAIQMEPMLNGHSNVLGIGHDFGGLVLRELANRNNSLSAMILNGVPNQGSAAITLATDNPAPGQPSSAQKIVEKSKGVQPTEGCDDCGILDIFESWIDVISANRDIFGQMGKSPQINYLNANLPPDNVPYAVLWSSVDEFSVLKLMDSYTAINPWSTNLTDCAEGAMQDAREDYETDSRTVGLIGNVGNFFQRTLSAFSGIVKDIMSGNNAPTATQYLESFANWFSSEKELIEEEIEKEREADQKLANIMRCELSHQMLAVNWQMALYESEAGEVTTEEIPLDPALSYNICIRQCQEQLFGVTTQLTAFDDCMSNCLQNSQTQTVQVYLPEENDGLLLKSEQMLDGAAHVYHLENHNHFQQTALSSDQEGNLDRALQDLFDGVAGPAFTIPKQ